MKDEYGGGSAGDIFFTERTSKTTKNKQQATNFALLELVILHVLADIWQSLLWCKFSILYSEIVSVTY